jgi:hypothetical protein
MRVYAQATNKTTSTGKAIYYVQNEMDGPVDDSDRNYELADLSDLKAGDDTVWMVLDDDKDFVILNDEGLIDIDREALRAAFPASDENFSEFSASEAVLTRETIATAIRQHGARAVYQAASRHMSDGKSLHGVGLNPGNLGDVWRAQSEAYARLSEADKAIDHADVQARLDELGND